MDQAIVQRLRDNLRAVMPSQKRAKELCVDLNLRWVEPEYVAEQKVSRGVLTQWLGLEKLLCRGDCIEVTAIKLRKHMRSEDGNSSARLKRAAGGRASPAQGGRKEAH